MKEQMWWYATRSAGLMTWSAAVGSVIVGLLLSLKAIRSRTGPWVLDLHRFLSGLTLVFLIVHLATLWADSYVEFGWRELLVPGESAYETQAVAWGIVSAWILVAVEITSLLRKHLGKKLWRVIHWTSALAVAGGTVHGLEIGTDANNPVVWALAGGGSIAIVVLSALRIRSAELKATGGRPRTESEILVEMRQRLADLPVEQAESRVEYVTEATSPLPCREAPVDEGLSVGVGMDDDPMGSGTLLEALGRAVRAEQPAEPDGFGADPFQSVPQPDALDTVGAWPGPSPDDPFAARTETDEPTLADKAPDDPPIPALRSDESGDTGVVSDHTHVDPTAPRPFLDQPVELDDATGMPDLSTSPFARTTDTAGSTAPAPPPAPRARLGDAPLSESADPTPAEAPAPYQPPNTAPAPTPKPAPAPEEAVPRLPSRPLRPVVPFSEPSPPPMSITAPAPAAAPTDVPVAPPELPVAAIDPATGEPDEAAYREWLVEWLAFAEQYGDEATSDPTRA